MAPSRRVAVAGEAGRVMARVNRARVSQRFGWRRREIDGTLDHAGNETRRVGR